MGRRLTEKQVLVKYAKMCFAYNEWMSYKEKCKTSVYWITHSKQAKEKYLKLAEEIALLNQDDRYKDYLLMARIME